MPWLLLLSLAGTGIGSYFQYQAAKRQEQQYADAVAEGKRQYEQNRRDALNKMYEAKLRYLTESRPFIRDNLSKLSAMSAFRKPVNTQPAQTGGFTDANTNSTANQFV